MLNTTQEEESKFLTSVVVALPTKSVVDYSEATQANSTSSSYHTAATLQPTAAMVAMAVISLSLQEDTVNLVKVKAPWEAEA